jgi:hypothetical protein
MEDYIEYAGSKIESVRKLKRTSKAIVHAGGTYAPRSLTPILGGILTLSSIWSPPLGESFKTAIISLSKNNRIDIGCCLEYGSFKIGYEEETKIFISKPESSLISFFLDLLDLLQSIGTVAAIDVLQYKASFDALKT